MLENRWNANMNGRTLKNMTKNHVQVWCSSGNSEDCAEQKSGNPIDDSETNQPLTGAKGSGLPIWNLKPQ